jgi:DUF1365 family protein
VSAGQRSAIYAGEVVHHRLRPRRHRLRYRVFYLLLDLDEFAALAGTLRLFSLRKFGLVSFRERDHGDGSDTPLRIQVEGQLRLAGLDLQGGPIRLLTLPRILGYVFNPVSVYFCYRKKGELAAVLYEVSNTFGDRHSYLIPVDDRQTGVVCQQSRKALHVSPFLARDMDYIFRLTPPDDHLALSIVANDASGPMMVATLTARRQTLSDGGLVRACLRCPFVTWKIIAAIHWEALKLWAKGLRFHRRPAPPAEPISLGRPLMTEETTDDKVSSSAPV